MNLKKIKYNDNQEETYLAIYSHIDEKTNKEIEHSYIANKNDETMKWVIEDIDIKIKAGYTVEPFVTKEENIKDRYARLETIWNKKTLGLKSLAIDKPYMKDAEAINNQYRVYEEMYKNAKAEYYDTVTNEAIIAANETVKQQLAPLTLLLNSVRGVLEALIATDATNVDEMLDAAEAITLTKEELTAEKLGEIMTVFGL